MCIKYFKVEECVGTIIVDALDVVIAGHFHPKKPVSKGIGEHQAEVGQVLLLHLLLVGYVLVVVAVLLYLVMVYSPPAGATGGGHPIGRGKPLPRVKPPGYDIRPLQGLPRVGLPRLVRLHRLFHAPRSVHLRDISVTSPLHHRYISLTSPLHLIWFHV